MKSYFVLTVSFLFSLSFQAQSDTIYGMNYTSGNLQFASFEISSNNTTLYGNGPVTADIFQNGVYDFDPIGKRYFYPRGASNVPQLITIDALSGAIIHSPLLTCSTPSVQPLTNVAYDWINDKLYGTHYSFENGNTELRMASVDVQSGLVTIINNASISSGNFVAGNCDIDPINGRFFMVVGSRIKTVDLITGSVVEDRNIAFPLGTTSEFVLNMTYNWSDGLIYCSYMYPNPDPNFFGSLLKLATLDPTTGFLTVISANPLYSNSISQGDCDIDVTGNRYFYIGQGQLHLVDLTTGALISSQNIQNPNGAVAPIINMAYDDLNLPQTVPATLNLPDTIYKLSNESVQIDAFLHPNATYVWSNGNASSSVNTSQEGDYSVSVWLDGFEVYGHTYVANISAVSVNENQIEVSLYPNPSSSWCYFTLETKQSEPRWVEIFSLEGVLVSREQIVTVAGSNKYSFNLRELAKGIYVVQIKSSEWTTSTYVIKE